MTKRRITNLMIVLVCAIFILPLTLNLFSAKASTNVVAYYGVDFTIQTSGDVKAAGSNVKIDVVEDVANAEVVTVYENGSIKSTEATAKGIVFSSYSNGKATLRIAKPAEYTITVTMTSDATKFETFNVKVLDNIESGDFIAPAYKKGYDYTDYQAKVDAATFVANDDPTAEKVSLYVGDTYKVPSVEELIESNTFAYSLFRRTVYYAAPGSSTYSSTSASGSSDLSFNISKVGGYRFYVVLSLAQVDGKSFSITTQNTLEREDGFYLAKKSVANGGARLFIKGTGDDAKYYEDEEFETEYAGATEFELVVPVFEFTILNAGPKVTIKTSYQEKGYIGLQYTVKSISVTGTDLDTTYALMYKETESADWAEATESYDSATGKFTPEKQGYYKVVVETVDADGKSAKGETAVITVTEKLQKVEYETSFKNWLSVNKTPFIFLCISAGCLVFILALIFIPASAFAKVGGAIKGVFKKKAKSSEEEDEE